MERFFDGERSSLSSFEYDVFDILVGWRCAYPTLRWTKELFLREFQQILLIAGCGALGAVCRYGVGLWLNSERFPLGTLLVNVVGCFLIGLIIQIADHGSISPMLKIALVVGFLGALTTFSAFGHETFKHIEAGYHLHALANISLNMILGLAAVWFGIISGRFFVG